MPIPMAKARNWVDRGRAFSVRNGTAEIQTLGYYLLSSLGLAPPVPVQAHNKVIHVITAIQFQYR